MRVAAERLRFGLIVDDSAGFSDLLLTVEQRSPGQASGCVCAGAWRSVRPRCRGYRACGHVPPIIRFIYLKLGDYSNPKIDTSRQP
jgi:hypothetical protein